MFVCLLALIFLYTLLGLISYQYTLPLLSPNPTLTDNLFYDYGGITHAQTNLSTGSGSIDEVVRAASQSKCQFLIITDLNLLQKPSDTDGYKNDVLVMFGGKFSFLGGHLLTYNQKVPWPFTGMGQAQIYFNDLLQNPPSKKLQLVAAHPYLPRHSWENLSYPGLNGMEILNLDSLWYSKITHHKLSVFWSFLMLPFNLDLSFLRLFSEPVLEINAWDENLKSRQFFGWAGSGATAKAIPFPDQVFKFPSYRRSFKLIKDHVLLSSELTGNFATDKEKVLDALSSGHFYFSLDILGDPTGFYFIAVSDRKRYLLGDEIKFTGKPITFSVDLGRNIDIPHEIILIKNGEKIEVSNGRSLTKVVNQRGAYRVEVRLFPKLPPPDGKVRFSWIYSNSIRVD